MIDKVRVVKEQIRLTKLHLQETEWVMNNFFKDNSFARTEFQEDVKGFKNKIKRLEKKLTNLLDTTK